MILSFLPPSSFLIPLSSFIHPHSSLFLRPSSFFLRYTPFDSQLKGDPTRPADKGGPIPRDPRVVHNLYPQLWAQVNREAVQEAGLEGEVVFFSRSAAIKSPEYATLFWMGDQLVTYDAFDGLNSAFLGMVSGGLSGHALSHSDIGGYTMIKECIKLPGRPAPVCFEYVRTPELLRRWAEASAFSDVVFRTHPGNLPATSAQIYDDDDALAAFAAFAKVHAAMWPYVSLGLC